MEVIKPRPGLPHIVNLCATMIQHGNSARSLNLARIAQHQGFAVDELSREFARQETEQSMKPSREVDDE